MSITVKAIVLKHGNNLAGNVIMFGADLSNSRHATNKTQNILILGEAFVQK